MFVVIHLYNGNSNIVYYLSEFSKFLGDTMHSSQQKVVALLGPTNTGKTHYAIERMLGFGNGLMGLPLRLLAKGGL